MNDFSEGAEVVGLGREFQRDNTLLESLKMSWFLSSHQSESWANLEGTSSRIIQISLQYIPAVIITEFVDELIDH